MRLTRYRVTNFRSIVDSGWIALDDVTTLVGENETGKTNLLLPLWKLNPAGGGGEIEVLADIPRRRYAELRRRLGEITFIEAEFAIDEALANELGTLAGCDADQTRTVIVGRAYDGKYSVAFPQADPILVVSAAQVVTTLGKIATRLSQLASQDHVTWSAALLSAQAELLAARQDTDFYTHAAVAKRIAAITAALLPDDAVASHDVRQMMLEEVEALFAGAKPQQPHDIASVSRLVIEKMPQFIYYSDYGTLDTRIYLPRVIEDLNRPAEDLGRRAAAQMRTLRVLFQFVGLSPKEIMDLGHEGEPDTDLSQEEMRRTARRKEEREVLLVSAATALSERFRAWWKRGNYAFRLSADGNYFTIWVSDAERSEPVQLEGRSHGLQWFLSFFIVFLVERAAQHSNAVLLLDEPGVTLHPLAQEDLFRFFAGLAQDNQLIYTAHSPFLIDPDQLSSVRVVFVNERGETEISADLRKPERDRRRARAMFAVDAALGLSVSHPLMRYAHPTIVEKISDQTYLTIAKTVLIAAGRIQPQRDVVFLVASGAQAIAATASIVGSKELPTVLLDSGATGRQTARILRSGPYASAQERILDVSAFADVPDAQIEDLMPRELMLPAVAFLYRTNDETLFSENYDAGRPIVPQIEAYCERQGIALQPGWRADLALDVERRAMRKPESVPPKTTDRWQSLFERLATTDDGAVRAADGVGFPPWNQEKATLLN
ncbi:MAG: AAA family ATPase [Candidatus Eremiobacteraeota bacterium]|nr:AAA family ATPase [Candidatus Eremiobacteraeota bacterium]MBV8332555.1 AAA family ATPase [Candidatus Eremiobacteraeota bacterium]